MCHVTHTLKLCTCKGDATKLQNYWVYNRLVPGKNMMIIGQPHWPLSLSLAISISNKRKISRMLNQGNCFDFEIVPIEDDHLYIYFNTGRGGDGVSYSFEFKKGKWRSFGTEPLMEHWYHDTYMQGVVKKGLTRNVEVDDLIDSFLL
jgi:hypothetical protein